MEKIITPSEVAKMIPDGARIGHGGFLACGTPDKIIDALVKEGRKNFHLIGVSSDFEDRGIGKLVANKQVTSAQFTHIGTNPATQAQYNSGELEIEFIPQGTILDRMRATGSGLGGILTEVGLGTLVEEGKQIIEVDGKKFLLEKPIAADFAIIKAHKADKMGNLVYKKVARNFNPVVATIAPVTFVEVDEIVEVGELDPESIITPGLYIDYIVKG
jgi:acetate CoA/acetoacetate CoA-transferase alpha subunit